MSGHSLAQQQQDPHNNFNKSNQGNSPQQRRQSHSQLLATGSARDFSAQSSQSGGSESSMQNGRKSKNAEDNPEWGLTKAGKKRQRLPLACQVCRKKKAWTCYFIAKSRFAVQASNPYVNIACGFLYLACIRQRRRDDRGIR
jgi:hypothetical protein